MASARATWARCPPESFPTGFLNGISSWSIRSRANAASQRLLSLPPKVMWSAAVNSR